MINAWGLQVGECCALHYNVMDFVAAKKLLGHVRFLVQVAHKVGIFLRSVIIIL